MAKVSDVKNWLGENAKDVSSPDVKDVVKRSINQAEYQTFMNDRGVTKAMLKQIADAQSEYCDGNVAYLTDIIVDSPEVNKASVSTRTPFGVLKLTQNREYHTRRPDSGEALTKYGTVSVQLRIKSRLDKELLNECMAAVEAASK